MIGMDAEMGRANEIGFLAYAFSPGILTLGDIKD